MRRKIRALGKAEAGVSDKPAICWTAAAALQHKREQEEQKAREAAEKEVSAAERKRRAQANKAKKVAKTVATAHRNKDRAAAREAKEAAARTKKKNTCATSEDEDSGQRRVAWQR